MIDTTAASVIIPNLSTEWPKLVSVTLVLASGYAYAHFRYAPVIRDLKNEIRKLQWQVHALRDERDALKTQLELAQEQCGKLTDRAYASAEENAMLRGFIKQNRKGTP